MNSEERGNQIDNLRELVKVLDELNNIEDLPGEGSKNIESTMLCVLISIGTLAADLADPIREVLEDFLDDSPAAPPVVKRKR